MGSGVEPRIVAKGSGWRVYRTGRSFCVQLDRADAEEPAEVWMRRQPSDVARSSLLAALVAGAHGAVDRQAAIDAMQADW